METPGCALCRDSFRPTTCVSLQPPLLQFLCALHSQSCLGSIIYQRNRHFFALAVQLSRNPDLSQQFWAQFAALPEQIARELASKWREGEDCCRFRALARPEDLIQLKDRDRLLRFLLKAGVQFPNDFITEVRAERLLEQMLQTRTSVTVIQSAFTKWPVGADKFRVLSCLVKSPYAPFEKKLLIEKLLPYYVESALKEDMARSIAVIESLKDKKLRRLAMFYVSYLQSLYILKATELNKVTLRLPRSLRRYIVEAFLCSLVTSSV